MLITVITPTLNRSDLLGEALESVARQALGSVALEHLVIDGDLSQRMQPTADAHVTWKFAAPAGVYDAYNVGLRAAAGDVVGFLNDDDVLPAGTLEKVARYFREYPDADLVSGVSEVVTLESPGSVARRIRSIDHQRILNADPAALLSSAPALNARWFSRAFLERLGLFDSTYRIVGDREFMLRVFRGGATNIVTGETLYTYRQHGGSLTFGGARSVQQIEEEIRVLAAFYQTCRDEELRRLTRQVSARRRWDLWRASALAREKPRGLVGVKRDPWWILRAVHHRATEARRLLLGQDPMDGTPRNLLPTETRGGPARRVDW